MITTVANASIAEDQYYGVVVVGSQSEKQNKITIINKKYENT
jgi:hypothetical protein